MKVAIVVSSLPDYMKSLIDEGFDIMVGLKEMPVYLRALRRIYFSIPFLNPSIWFSKEFKDLKGYDVIIIFANYISSKILGMLSKKHPNTNFIFWYWNPISSTVNPSYIPKSKNIHICTFDPEDAKCYGINFVEAFSLQTTLAQVKKKSSSSDYDVYFVGLDKNRAAKLSEFKTICSDNNISFKYNLVKDNTSKDVFSELYSSPVKYEEVINNVNKSKAILDLVQNRQSGLSQRFFESIFLDKKIITNNFGVTQTHLYDPNRIFLLGRDDINSLKKFIENPLEPISSEILNYYSPQSWLERIISVIKSN